MIATPKLSVYCQPGLSALELKISLNMNASEFLSFVKIDTNVREFVNGTPSGESPSLGIYSLSEREHLQNLKFRGIVRGVYYSKKIPYTF